MDLDFLYDTTTLTEEQREHRGVSEGSDRTE